MPQQTKPRHSTVYGTNPPPRTPYLLHVEEPTPIPALRLRGRWLAQAGFDIGAQIEIMVSEGELVLRVLPDSSASSAERVDTGDLCRGAYL